MGDWLLSRQSARLDASLAEPALNSQLKRPPKIMRDRGEIICSWQTHAREASVPTSLTEARSTYSPLSLLEPSIVAIVQAALS